MFIPHVFCSISYFLFPVLFCPRPFLTRHGASSQPGSASPRQIPSTCIISGLDYRLKLPPFTNSTALPSTSLLTRDSPASPTVASARPSSESPRRRPPPAGPACRRGAKGWNPSPGPDLPFPGVPTTSAERSALTSSPLERDSVG